LIAGLLILIVLRSKYLLKLYWKIEYRFVVNFNQRILEERRRNSLKQNGGIVVYDLDNTNWIESNLYVGKFRLEADSEYENKMLKDTDFRKRYDLIIIRVRRNEEERYFPNGDFELKSGDILMVAGNIMNINRLMTMQNRITMYRSSLRTIHEFSKQQDNDPLSDIKCISLIVEENSALNGKSLIESQMSKKKRCFVVGQESNESVRINPPASTIFSADDILWIIGDKESIYDFVKENLHL
jgi:CPA2 family monovalent cation:H+ antiporter-2